MDHAARRLAAGLALPLKEAQAFVTTRPEFCNRVGDNIAQFNAQQILELLEIRLKELHTLWNARQAMTNMRHRAAADHIESLDGKGDVESFANPPAVQILFPVFIGRGDEWGVEESKGDLLYDNRRERAVESNPLFDLHDPNFEPVYTLHSKTKLTPFEAELDHVARCMPHCQRNTLTEFWVTGTRQGRPGIEVACSRSRHL
jgi:hypothetical protein